MQFGPQGKSGPSLPDAMHEAIEGWPFVLSTMQGMMRQAEEAGFSTYVAKILVLAQFGVPVPQLERADLEGKS